MGLIVRRNMMRHNFLTHQIEGDARVQHDRLLEDTRRVFAAIRDTGYHEPEDLPGWLEMQQRVILRITPRRVYGVIR